MKLKKADYYPGLTILAILLFVNFNNAQTPADLEKSQQFERRAIADYKDKKIPEFLGNMQKANDLRPNHPRLIYNLSAAYALNGKSKKALETLERLSKMGLYFPIEKDEDFKSLFFLKKFKKLQKQFIINKKSVNKSSKVFSLDDKKLITEGIAYDSQTKRFFISSIHQRKIIAVDQNGKVSDFSSDADGLWSVLGMKVDEKRRILWVCSTVFPQMRQFNEEEKGRSGIFKYDLTSGKLLRKYLFSEKGEKHALGDLVVNHEGDVFATDSVSPIIYRIDSEKDELEVFLENENFSSLQGITFSPDERFLFVADYSQGIFKIDVASKKIIYLTPAENITLLGIDGLYYHKGNLIAIQNGVNPQRVIRLFLNKNQTQIKKFETLEANHKDFNEPTLGVLVGNRFHFIANSQWNFVNQKGELAEEKLQKPVILSLNL